MATYQDIPNAELDIDAPVKSSTAKLQRDNPLAIFEGDPTALAAGKGAAIDKAGQTCIITDEVDIDKALTPDGLGGAKWSSGVSGLILVERKEILVNTTIVDFIGLNGNLHQMYLLLAHMKVFGANNITLRENGTSAGNVGGLKNDGIAYANSIGRLPPVGGFFNRMVTLQVVISAAELIGVIPVLRMFEWQQQAVQSQVLNSPIDLTDSGQGSCSQRLAGNLTTFGLGGGANWLRPGSVLDLYRYSQGT